MVKPLKAEREGIIMFDNLKNFYEELLYFGKFDYMQLKQVRKAIENGLTKEWIELIANPDNPEWVMEETVIAFKKGVSMEQAEVALRPAEFDCDQQIELLWAFEYGLGMDQVLLFAKPEYDDEQMAQLRIAFEHGLSMEQILLFAKPEFDSYQMHELREAFEHGLTDEQITFITDSKLDWEQMYELREAFVD